MMLKKLSYKKIGKILSSILFYAFVAIFIAYIVLSGISPKTAISVFNYQHYVIQTGSMDPTLKIGDIIVVKKVDIKDLKRNDIITFYADIKLNGNKEIVTHYFVMTEVNSNGDTIYRTRRENTNTLDSWQVHEEDIIGHVIGKISNLGKVIMFFRSPIGIAVLIVDIAIIYYIIRLLNKPKENLENIKTET